MANVWKITGKNIGPAGCGAEFFSEKKDASAKLKEYRKDKKKGDVDYGEGPEKVVVRGRVELVRALNTAMGYGSIISGSIR
jgi:hypothetical protein